MRKLLLSALFLAAGFSTMAQTKESKKKKHKTAATKAASAKNTDWKLGGSINLALSQGGSRNWAPGADRFTLSTNAFVNLFANYSKKKMHWNTILDANYGLMNTDQWGIIKNDDKLEVTSKWWNEFGKLNKKGRSSWAYGVTANFRTQFTDGYDYDGDSRKRISAFMAPGIIVVSPGIDYIGVKGLTIHGSPIAARWVLVPSHPYELAANYGVKPNHEVKNEFGSYLSIGYTGKIAKNVYYRGRFDTYADYVGKEPFNMDLYFTNMFYLKVSKYLAVVYNFDMQYDDNTKMFGFYKNAPRTQLKSILGVGLNVNF